MFSRTAFVNPSAICCKKNFTAGEFLQRYLLPTALTKNVSISCFTQSQCDQCKDKVYFMLVIAFAAMLFNPCHDFLREASPTLKFWKESRGLRNKVLLFAVLKRCDSIAELVVLQKTSTGDMVISSSLWSFKHCERNATFGTESRTQRWRRGLSNGEPGLISLAWFRTCLICQRLLFSYFSWGSISFLFYSKGINTQNFYLDIIAFGRYAYVSSQ